MKEKLIKEAGFSTTFEIDRLEKLIEITIKECVVAIKNTPTHCAFTTHDLGTVQCTIDKTIETVYNHFNMDKRGKL
jgi:hypothetical protein